MLERYTKIKGHFPREMGLLQGMGCRWHRCTFCDYHTDTNENPYATNAPVLELVTGEMGVLDIINSGSGIELDEQTLDHIARVVKEKQIHTLWFEMHYMYRHRLADFAAREFDELTDVLGICYNRKEETLDEEVNRLIEERNKARAAKDYATADKIRDDLKALGIQIKDTKDGTEWTLE